MKSETLKAIKKDLAKLYQLVNPLADYYNSGFPGYQIVAILLQNAAFDGSDCAGYSHEADVKKLKTIRGLLQAFVTYDPHHEFYSFVYEEYTMIIDGNLHCEDIP